MSDSKEKDWSRSRSAREPRGEPLQRKGGSGVFRPSTAYASSTCKQTKAPR